MTYIAHRQFDGIAASGRNMSIPRETELPVISGWIATPGGEAVCAVNSENSKMHFSINDDKQGLERGALTWAIAYEPRRIGEGFRFSGDEIELLEKEYVHWLRDTDVILFNNDFFTAPVHELQKLADTLHIKPREVM